MSSLPPPASPTQPVLRVDDEAAPVQRQPSRFAAALQAAADPANPLASLPMECSDADGSHRSPLSHIHPHAFEHADLHSQHACGHRALRTPSLRGGGYRGLPSTYHGVAYAARLVVQSLTILECGSGGDCLFHVVAHFCLGDAALQQDCRDICDVWLAAHQEVKDAAGQIVKPAHQLVRQLIEELQLYPLYDLQGNRILTLAQYRAHIISKGAYGGTTHELQILAEHFGVDFLVMPVVCSAVLGDHLVLAREFQPGPTQRSARTLAICYVNTPLVLHFQALIDSAEPVPAGAIDDRLTPQTNLPDIPPNLIAGDPALAEALRLSQLESRRRASQAALVTVSIHLQMDSKQQDFEAQVQIVAANSSAISSQLGVFLDQSRLLSFSFDHCIEPRKFRPTFGLCSNRILIGSNAVGKSSLVQAAIQSIEDSNVANEHCIYIPAMFDCTLRHLQLAPQAAATSLDDLAGRHLLYAQQLHERPRDPLTLRQLLFWLWDPEFLLPEQHPDDSPQAGLFRQAKAKQQLTSLVCTSFQRIFKNRALTLDVPPLSAERKLSVQYLEDHPQTPPKYIALGGKFKANDMDLLSDGERRALYYLLILALNFNSADGNRRLRELSRPELFTTFHSKRSLDRVYFTFLTHAHDLAWCQQMQRGYWEEVTTSQSRLWQCHVLLVLGHDPTEDPQVRQWRIMAVDLQQPTDQSTSAAHQKAVSDFPLELLFRQLVGSKPILMLEGKPKESLDSRVYSRLFPEYEVQSHGSCDHVLRVMSTYTVLRKSRHVSSGQQTHALIDLDRRFSSAELEEVEQTGTRLLRVSAVENLIASWEFLQLRTRANIWQDRRQQAEATRRAEAAAKAVAANLAAAEENKATAAAKPPKVLSPRSQQKKDEFMAKNAAAKALKAQAKQQAATPVTAAVPAAPAAASATAATPPPVVFPRTVADLDTRFQEWVRLLSDQYHQHGLREYMVQVRLRDHLREHWLWLGQRSNLDLFTSIARQSLQTNTASVDFLTQRPNWLQEEPIVADYLKPGCSFWLDDPTNRALVYKQFGQRYEIDPTSKLARAVGGGKPTDAKLSASEQKSAPPVIAATAGSSSLSSYYSVSAFFSSLSFYYHSLVAHLPIPAFLRGTSLAKQQQQQVQSMASCSASQPIWRTNKSLPTSAELQDLMQYLLQQERHHRLLCLQQQAATPTDVALFEIPALAPDASNQSTVYFNGSEPSLLRIIRGHDLEHLFKLTFGETPTECLLAVLAYSEKVAEVADEVELEESENLWKRIRQLYAPAPLHTRLVDDSRDVLPVTPLTGGILTPCMMHLRIKGKSTLWRFADADLDFLRAHWPVVTQLMVDAWSAQSAAAANTSDLLQSMLGILRQASFLLTSLSSGPPEFDRCSASSDGAVVAMLYLMVDKFRALQWPLPSKSKEVELSRRASAHIAFAILQLVDRVMRGTHYIKGTTRAVYIRLEQTLWQRLEVLLEYLGGVADLAAAVFVRGLLAPFLADDRKKWLLKKPEVTALWSHRVLRYYKATLDLYAKLYPALAEHFARERTANRECETAEEELQQAREKHKLAVVQAEQSKPEDAQYADLRSNAENLLEEQRLAESRSGRAFESRHRLRLEYDNLRLASSALIAANDIDRLQFLCFRYRFCTTATPASLAQPMREAATACLDASHAVIRPLRPNPAILQALSKKGLLQPVKTSRTSFTAWIKARKLHASR